MNEHENCEERIAQLEAEVSMLRYQLRAADDRVDVKLVALERENAELRKNWNEQGKAFTEYRIAHSHWKAEAESNAEMCKALSAQLAKLETEIEWRTSESATFRRERDEAREEIAELRKWKERGKS